LRVWERLEAMVAGRKQLALAAVVDATTELGLAAEDARHEVAAALRLAPVTAHERTRVAVELRDRLPATLGLLCAGEIGWRQAANVADGVRDLPDDLARAVQARVLDRMPRQTAAETRRSVADAVVRVDPAAAAARAEQAHRDRRIERLDQPGSMRSWWVPAPADVEHDMWSALPPGPRPSSPPGPLPGWTTSAWTRCGSTWCATRSSGSSTPRHQQQQAGRTALEPRCRSAGAAASRSPRSWSTCRPPWPWRSTPG
jgi:hypothetical protein